MSAPPFGAGWRRRYATAATGRYRPPSRKGQNLNSPGVTVVGPSRPQREGLAAFLVLAVGFALVRGLIGAETTAGRIAVGVIFGGLLVLILVGWARLVHHPELLEISDKEIRQASRSGRETPVIQRERGDTLRFVSRSSGRVRLLALSQSASGTSVTLNLFSRKKVQAACEAHGWRIEP